MLLFSELRRNEFTPLQQSYCRNLLHYCRTLPNVCGVLSRGNLTFENLCACCWCSWPRGTYVHTASSVKITVCTHSQTSYLLMSLTASLISGFVIPIILAVCVSQLQAVCIEQRRTARAATSLRTRAECERCGQDGAGFVWNPIP